MVTLKKKEKRKAKTSNYETLPHYLNKWLNKVNNSDSQEITCIHHETANHSLMFCLGVLNFHTETFSTNRG